jgi:murein DD-endopeptidase MepM/ murein hydrolase activator NlpD
MKLPAWTPVLVLAAAFLLFSMAGCISSSEPAACPPQPACTSCPVPELGVHVQAPPLYSLLGGGPVLFYELYISNYTPPGIYRLEVLENGPDGRVLKTVEGDELNKTLRAPQKGVSDYIVFMWVDLDANSTPASIYHKLYVNKSGTPETVGAATDVGYAPPVVISPPVKGDGWLAAEAPSNYNHHRTAVITFQGTPRVPERYAIDWVRYGRNGKMYKTDGKANEDYYAYGADLLAVADGTVVDAKDGIPDNLPGTKPPVTLAAIAGNYVMLDIGNGSYAFYAHMIPGSVKVKAGDEVKAGDALGKLGNSGNSDLPHLHFHVDTGKDALFSDGLPYVFPAYRLQGEAKDWGERFEADAAWSGWLQQPEERAMTMPVNGDVVSLP